LYRPIEAANELLQKNGVASTDVALISHQSSSVLVDKWQEGIKPGQYINTVAEYANMTLATMAVNFASKYDEISKDYVVLLGVGVDFQTVATLLRRN
jgi:3-oxoacyl-[acyl-carrier-protein] synthase-3